MNPFIFKREKYELIKELGSGGVGFVWEAKRKETGARFAIKFYDKQAECDRERQMVLEIFKRCDENLQMRDRFLWLIILDFFCLKAPKPIKATSFLFLSFALNLWNNMLRMKLMIMM